MYLAILGATPGEIGPFRGLFPPSGSLNIAGNHFSTHIHGDLRLLIGTTGVGKVNAAATAAALLSSFKVAEVWNIGCAGAYAGSGLDTGDVLITSSCICGDEGILGSEGAMPTSILGIPLVIKDGEPIYDFFPLGEFVVRRQIQIIFPAGFYSLDASGGIYSRDHGPGIEKGGFKIEYGPSLTVGMVSGDIQTAAERWGRYGALAENMEGSAIAQTCFLFDAAFLEFRGISNMAGVRDKSKWDLDVALKHCLAVTKNLVLRNLGI